MYLRRLFTSRKYSSGFTLIELLVVIAIIAVISTIGLSSFQGAAKSGRDGKRKGDLSQIRAALELYRSNPPPPATGYPSTTNIDTLLNTLKGAGYMSDPLPKDPKNGYSYIYTPGTGVYVLCAHLETTNTGNSSRSDSIVSSGSLDYLCVTQP